jgi:hypothetical protein
VICGCAAPAVFISAFHGGNAVVAAPSAQPLPVSVVAESGRLENFGVCELPLRAW